MTAKEDQKGPAHKDNAQKKDADKKHPKHDHKQDTEKLLKEADELKDTLQRLQAEFENYRKRCDRENASFVKHANESLIKSLLPILDNFGLALAHHDADDEFHKGVKLIFSQLSDTLEENGLKPIDCKGQKFDPRLHEALIAEASDLPKDMIIEELQKGYLFSDKVLRHSKVKISKGKGEGAPPSGEPVKDASPDESDDNGNHSDNDLTPPDLDDKSGQAAPDKMKKQNIEDDKVNGNKEESKDNAQ
ncbi:nucleotide exchange factor GrpE [Candidatus Woesearchaeota archaeon]|nr:nucleotide exchange factor GrpE [Candidatus Woesearchaeota archaeon]